MKSIGQFSSRTKSIFKQKSTEICKRERMASLDRTSSQMEIEFAVDKKEETKNQES